MRVCKDTRKKWDFRRALKAGYKFNKQRSQESTSYVRESREKRHSGGKVQACSVDRDKAISTSGRRKETEKKMGLARLWMASMRKRVEGRGGVQKLQRRQWKVNH